MLLVPAFVAVHFGWIRIQKPSVVVSGRSETPLEAYAILSVFYVFWVVLVVIGLVATLDRLGYKYTPYDRPPRAKRSKRRRLRASLRYMEARQQPPIRRPKGTTAKKRRPPGSGKAA